MNPTLLQRQLKENANDLQDFYKDLKSWGEEMKRKDDSLNSQGDFVKKSKVQTTKASPKIIKGTAKEKISKFGLTDYAKWEKFDADLECERLEEDIRDDSELTDEFEESARDEALVHKEKGNSYVKSQDWDKAIDCYTKAINLYSYDPVFYANRALCYLKKQSYIAAEEDCTLSLKLDRTYVKAFQRRAAAREALGKLEFAQGDLETVLTHEPRNKESAAMLARIRKKIGFKEKPSEDEQRPVSKFTASRNKIHPPSQPYTNNSIKRIVDPKNIKIDTSIPSTSGWPDPQCEIIPVKSIKKPPHLRSQKPLKIIKIVDIDNLPELKPDEPHFEEPEAIKKHVVEHIKESVIDPSELIEKASAFKKNREKMKNEKNESLYENAWPKATQASDIIRSDDLKILEKKPVPENKPKEVKNTENIFITKMDNRAIKHVETSKQTAVKKEFNSPKTSVQFCSTWKTLKTLSDKYNYLKLIGPQEIPKIFRDTLDSKVFSSIVDVLATSFVENGDEVYDFLFGLTQIKRFSALVLLMDLTDRDRLWKLITYLRENNKIPSEQVDKLVLEYEL